MPPLLREWETDYPGFAAGGAEQSLQIQRWGHIPGWLLSAFGRFTFSSRPTGSPSSAPVCALGHLPPGRGKAGREVRCAAPTAYTEAIPPFRRGRTPAGPQMYAARPGGRALRFSTSHTCSAYSGADAEPQQRQFFQSQGPVARREFRPSLRFCAPEMLLHLSGTRPS